MLQSYLMKFIHWILPRICLCCGLDSEEVHLDLCASCKDNLPWINNRCYACCLELTNTSEAILCDHCRNNPPLFNRIYALFAYQPPITRLVTQLKFSKKLSVGLLMANLLAEAITTRWYKGQLLPQIIIPVPLHKLRQRDRGYNQAVEICRPLAKILDIPFGQHICQRVKYTQQQSRLNKQQRNVNLINAFTAEVAAHYKHVVIVDDVVTSGSTVRAMCLALLAAGVETIDVWCIARA